MNIRRYVLAAILVNVPAGSDTILLRGKSNTTGVAIIEVFKVPDTL